MAIEPSIYRSPVDESARWWAAQVQPQDEMRVAAAVTDLGGYGLVPLEHVRKTYERKNKKLVTVEWDRPIFPGYVFYAGDRDCVFEARQIIRVFGSDRETSDQIRNFVRAYEGGPIRLAQSCPLTVGLRVKIVAGVYMGTEGFIERFGDEKVFIRIKSIGIAELETDRSNIEPFIGD